MEYRFLKYIESFKIPPKDTPLKDDTPEDHKEFFDRFKTLFALSIS